MQIQQSTIRKIQITEIKGLDPVSVYLEDFEPRKGEITISCYDKSWKSYWGGMSDRTIAQFFLSCDNHYIAKNLSSISSDVPDYDAFSTLVKKLTKEAYDEIGDCEFSELHMEADSRGDDEWEGWIHSNSRLMGELFGEDWYYALPNKINPDYKYLCNIIDVVKEALRSLEESSNVVHIKEV